MIFDNKLCVSGVDAEAGGTGSSCHGLALTPIGDSTPLVCGTAVRQYWYFCTSKAIKMRTGLPPAGMGDSKVTAFLGTATAARPRGDAVCSCSVLKKVKKE
jgi:hypothetical protein